MKTLSQLTRNDIKNIKVLCLDCDGVTVEKGTYIQENQNKLIVRTKTLTDQFSQKLNLLKSKFLIIFSSGRTPLYLARMYEKVLWNNVILQGENGIISVYEGKIFQSAEYPLRLLKIITKIKNDIRQLSRTNNQIRGFEPKQFLLTIHCQSKVPSIKKIIQKYDIQNEFYCLWNGEAYDVAPKLFNKGIGLKFLIAKLNLKMDNVLALGNDLNDREMVEWAKIGITTDPSGPIKKARFVTSQKLHRGGEEVLDKLLTLTNLVNS